jgi:outer membrane protein assembly factor BamE (lipoprotein component of BamABCDE complex)
MNSSNKQHRHIASRGLLAAGLLLGVAAAAQAAGGFTVTKSQESAITVGMSTAEVMQALGRPEHRARYASEPGPTWTYTVVGATAHDALLFDVDFDASGKVASVSERVEEMD